MRELGYYSHILLSLSPGHSARAHDIRLKNSEVYKLVLFTFQGYFVHDFCDPEQSAVTGSMYSEVSFL